MRKPKDGFVKMEQHQCPVCLELHTHGTGILIHRNFREIPDNQTVTGHSLCEVHAKQYADGYVFLIGVDNAPIEGKDTLTPREARRTGDIVSIKRHAFDQMFQGVSPGKHGVTFADKEVVDYLKTIQVPEGEK